MSKRETLAAFVIGLVPYTVIKHSLVHIRSAHSHKVARMIVADIRLVVVASWNGASYSTTLSAGVCAALM